MGNEAIYFSRCRVEKGKWLWVLKTEAEYFEGKDPCAFGYANSAVDAEAIALRTAKDQYPGIDIIRVQGYTAEYFKRCLTAKNKAKKRATATTTAQVEYVYRDDYDGDGSVPHRIVKKTKQRVYVEKDSCYGPRRCEYGDWRDFANQRTIVLDRNTLEQEGEAWSRTSRNFFYSTPYEERRHRCVPECGQLLGLRAPWTTDQVKQAFRRLAKTVHPDAGGDDEKFKSLHATYIKALKIAVDRGTS